jgi:CheY-like chemotaxis protein
MGRRILVVDDDDLVRGVLRDMLELAGHEVYEAQNGAEALARLRHSGVDLMLTDLVMPDCDGIEVLRKVREDYPDLPVLAMSGAQSASVYLSAAKALGAGAVLAKPIGPLALAAAVAQMFGE